MRANAKGKAILARSLQVADIQVDQWIIDMLIHSVMIIIIIIIIENIQHYILSYTMLLKTIHWNGEGEETNSQLPSNGTPYY